MIEYDPQERFNSILAPWGKHRLSSYHRSSPVVRKLALGWVTDLEYPSFNFFFVNILPFFLTIFQFDSFSRFELYESKYQNFYRLSIHTRCSSTLADIDSVNWLHYTLPRNETRKNRLCFLELTNSWTRLNKQNLPMNTPAAFSETPEMR